MPGLSASVPAPAGRGNRLRLFLYALAYTGAFISFIPFFGIFLPLKVEAIAYEDRLRLLSQITILGAITASIANILFGMISDDMRARRGSRRPMIAAGALCIALAYGLIAEARSPAALIASVLLLQAAINMMFGPLVAVMADEVPDRRKGTVAGLLAVAHPTAALVGSLLLAPALAVEGLQFAAFALISLGTILPFCLLFRETSSGSLPDVLHRPKPPMRDLALAWAARLAVQIAGTAVATYIFVHLRTIVPSLSPVEAGPNTSRAIATLMAASTIVAIPVALLTGWVSDRWNSRRPLIALAAAGMSAGLCGLMGPASWLAAGFSHMLFLSSYSAFIALHSAFAMEILPSPRHRGRDLGILNLTNTLPSLVVPTALLTVPGTQLAPIFLALAATTTAAGILVLCMASGRPPSRAGMNATPPPAASPR